MCDTETIGGISLSGFGVADFCGMPVFTETGGEGNSWVELGNRGGERMEIIESIINGLKRGWQSKTDGTKLSKLITLWGDEGETIAVVHLVIGTLPITHEIGCKIPHYSGACSPEILRINSICAMRGLPTDQISIPLHILSDSETYSDASWMCAISVAVGYLQEWDYSICLDTAIGGILSKEKDYPDLSTIPYPLRNHASELSLIKGVMNQGVDILIRDSVNYLRIVKERISDSGESQLLALSILSCDAFPAEHISSFCESLSSIISSSDKSSVIDLCLSVLSKIIGSDDSSCLKNALPAVSKVIAHPACQGPLQITCARIISSVITTSLEEVDSSIIEKTFTTLLSVTPRGNTIVRCLSLIAEGLLAGDGEGFSGLAEFLKFGWKSAVSGSIDYAPLARVLLTSLKHGSRSVPESRLPTALVHMMRNCGIPQPAIAQTALEYLLDGYTKSSNVKNFSECLTGNEVAVLVNDFLRPSVVKLLNKESDKKSTTSKKKKKKSTGINEKTILHSSLFTRDAALEMLRMTIEVICTAGSKEVAALDFSANDLVGLRDACLLSESPAVFQLLKLLKGLSCDHYNTLIGSVLTNNIIQLSLGDVELCSLLSELLIAVFDCKSSLFAQNNPGPSSQPEIFCDTDGSPLNGITLLSLRYHFSTPPGAISALLKWSASGVQNILFGYYGKMLIDCIIDRSPLNSDHESCLADILSQGILLATAQEIQAHNVYAMQLIAGVVKYFSFFRRDELGIESKVKKLIDKHQGIITGIGKYCTAKGMKSTVDDDVRSAVLSAIVYSVKLLPWDQKWYSLDLKLLKKVIFIYEKHPVCRPLIEELISLIAIAASPTPKDSSKVSEYFMPLALNSCDIRLIILLGQCKTGLTLLYDHPDRGGIYRKLQESFVDRSHSDLLDETTKVINNLLEEEKIRQAAAVEEQKKALANFDEQRRREEKELEAVNRAREEDAEYHAKKQQIAEELFKEIQTKIEHQKSVVAKEENRKRTEGTQRVKAAQKEERKKRAIEVESRKLQEAERRSREYALMQEHKTLHELHSIGIPQYKARAAMLHNNNTTDCDMLIEWLVQYGDEIVKNKSHPEVSGIRVTGTGAVQIISSPTINDKRPEPIAPMITPKEESSTAKTGDENSEDEYQDFWAVDVDVTKNIKLLVDEETQNYEIQQQEGDDDDHSSVSSESDSSSEPENDSENKKSNFHGNEKPQHSDFHRLFQLKFDALASSHPLVDTRKVFPTWHSQMAPILDLFDFNQNTRTRLSDIRYFSQQDLGFKWFSHIGNGFVNIRTFLDWLQQKGLVAFKQNSKKDPTAVDFVVLTRFGIRYHKKYWDRTTSIAHRKPIEDERRSDIQKQREEQLASARKMALSALLKMKSDRDAPDPESFVLPDWFIEEEVQEQTDRNRINQKDIHQLQVRAREKRLRKLLRSQEKSIPQQRAKIKKPTAAPKAPKQPVLSAAETAAEQRRQAVERAEQRKQAHLESERRTAVATRNTTAGWKRLRQKQGPSNLNFKLFVAAVAVFWIYMIITNTHLLTYINREYGPAFNEHIVIPVTSLYYELTQ